MARAAAPRRAHGRRLRPQPGASATSTASRTWSQQLPAPRVVWVMVPAGDTDPADRRRARRAARAPATSSSTAATRATPTTSAHAAHARPSRASASSTRRLRRRLGPDERLRADGRRRAPSTSRKVQPIFDALKPEGDSGFVHAGPVGAGHFAKMVHNGIEYGLMQAYAEGYELLEAADVVDRRARRSSSPGTQGTVVRSWLLDLLVPRARGGPRARPRSAATPRTPARAGGPSRRPSTTRCRCR